MKSKCEKIFILADECTSLCGKISDCLKIEKTALIQFKIEDLLENNSKKERLLSELIEQRRLLREIVKGLTGKTELISLDEQFSGEQKIQWMQLRERWFQVWEETKSLCEQNKGFIDHSLRNLNMFGDNLKRLFANNVVYTQKGKASDSQGEGKVMEGSY